MKEIRLLKAEEIECRVSVIREDGLSLLLFKDARVDQKILDETFGIFGWKRTHQCIEGNLYCTVEIWDEETKQWVAKQDVGTMSYSSKEKGQASDSFKRACFNVGIGRELYTAPFIWLPRGNVSVEKKDGKYTTAEHFSVKEIAYSKNREITRLSIINAKGIPVYTYGGKDNKALKQKLAGGLDREKNLLLEKELARTGVALKTVLTRYNLNDTEEMTDEIYESAMNALKKSKSRNAA